jgi:hypothetical protein
MTGKPEVIPSQESASRTLDIPAAGPPVAAGGRIDGPIKEFGLKLDLVELRP